MWGVVLGVAAIWVAVGVFFANDFGDQEKCQKQVEAFRATLDPNPWVRYRNRLEHLLGWVERAFDYGTADGTTSVFARPWLRCLQIALVYPLAFFLVAYLFGERGDVAGLEMLDAEAPLLLRIGVVGYCLGVFGFFFVAVQRDWFEQVGRWGARRIGLKVQGRPSVLLARVLGALVFAVAVAVAFAVAVADPVAVAVAGAVVFAVAVAGAGAVAGAVAGGVIIMMFFVFFPVVNSLLDWLSLSVTRHLMRQWVRPQESTWKPVVGYIGATTLDVTIAFVCICLLAGLLAATVAGANLLLSWVGEPDAGQLDWMGMMAAFRHDPWGQGLMVTLMLFSTLLPTLVHLAAGLGAALKLPNLGRAYVVEGLANGPPAATERFKIGMVAAVGWVIPVVPFVVLGGLAFRFFLPMSWIHDAVAAVPYVPPAWLEGLPQDGYLITWAPYAVAEVVWTALGGAPAGAGGP